MQIVSFGDNLHEMSNPTFWGKNLKNISTCRLLKLLPSLLSVMNLDRTDRFHLVRPPTSLIQSQYSGALENNWAELGKHVPTLGGGGGGWGGGMSTSEGPEQPHIRSLVRTITVRLLRYSVNTEDFQDLPERAILQTDLGPRCPWMARRHIFTGRGSNWPYYQKTDIRGTCKYWRPWSSFASMKFDQDFLIYSMAVYLSSRHTGTARLASVSSD